MLTIHPAPGMGSPGLGYFMPAYWTLPQNPLYPSCGLGDIVDGIYYAPDNGVVPELLAKKKAAEYLTENPLGPVGLSCGPASSISSCPCHVGLCGGVGILDCGGEYPCPCEGSSCGGNLVTGLHGLGGLNGTLDDVLSSVTSGGWTTWAMVGAGVLALVMFTGGGGSQRSAELAAAKAQYKAKVAGIKVARPRRYQKYV
jgi:hypothetical protein